MPASRLRGQVALGNDTASRLLQSLRELFQQKLALNFTAAGLSPVHLHNIDMLKATRFVVESRYCDVSGTNPTFLTPRKRPKIFRLEHQLHAPDDFVELVLAKLRMRLAEIRPGVDIIDHQLDIVAVDVVVEPAGDGMDAVATPLPGV